MFSKVFIDKVKKEHELLERGELLDEIEIDGVKYFKVKDVDGEIHLIEHLLNIKRGRY